MLSEIHSGNALAPVKRRALARTFRRAGPAAASAMGVKPAGDVVRGAHAAERGLDEERAPRRLRGESALDRGVDFLLHHELRLARLLGFPAGGASRPWVRAAMVSAASTPAWALALAMAKERFARRRETMRTPN